MRNAWIAIFILAGLAGLAQVPPVSNAPPPVAPALAAPTNAPGTLLTNLSGYVPDDKYKLRVGDKVNPGGPRPAQEPHGGGFRRVGCALRGPSDGDG